MSFEFLPSLFVRHGHWILFGGIFLDNAGLPLPGELLLLAFGALAGTGELNPVLGVLLAASAALCGDSFGYWLGRLGGDRVLHTYCRLTLGSRQCAQNAVSYYKQHGRATVVFGRFVIGVRAFLAPLAGSARMPFGEFLLFDSFGALIWSALFILIGYSFRWEVARVQQGYRTGYSLLAGVLTAGVVAYLLVKLYRRWRHGSGSLGRPDARAPREVPAAEAPGLDSEAGGDARDA